MISNGSGGARCFCTRGRLDGAQLILLGMVDLTERKRGEQERELLTSRLFNLP
jgi:hypothetical protein